MLTRTRLTARQFELIADELGPSELERGEVVTLSPGGMGHSGLSNLIAYYLTQWALKSRRGRVYSNEAGIITQTRPDTVRGADVAYFSFRRLPKSRTPDGFTNVAPELVVEIIGKGQGWRKMMEKAAEYLQMGVDRVGIVDPKKKQVCILRADHEPTILAARQFITDPGVLPGFRCRVSALFR